MDRQHLILPGDGIGPEVTEQAHRVLVRAAQTEGVAAPINLAPRRPVPMAVMNYETFEATVDHADLPECPKALAAEGRFCRATIHDDALHVFAFSEDLDQPLQAVMDFPMDEIRFPD